MNFIVFKLLFVPLYILIILALTHRQICIVLAWVNCFKSQMGCSSGDVESALGPLLPGLVSSVAVVDASFPTPAVFLCLSRRFLHLQFLGLSLSPVKWHKRVRFSHFSRLSFPFLILQGSVLARTNDAEPWAPTHRTVCYSHSQILAGLLLRRGTTGECGRMVSAFPLSKSQKRLKLQSVSENRFAHAELPSNV